jgi:8-amino-7-oxononanoate synthase
VTSAWAALQESLNAALAEADGASRRRRLRPMTREPGGRVRLPDGRVLIDFSSNDYMGLALHPQVTARAADYAARLGAGAPASRLVTGTLPEHLMVEERLAVFKGTEAALLFASGYQANASVLPALIDFLPGPVKVFADRLNHASLHAGLAQAGVRQIRFRHNDLDHLERQMAAIDNQGPSRLIVTESVFSMDGDRADLMALVELAIRTTPSSMSTKPTPPACSVRTGPAWSPPCPRAGRSSSWAPWARRWAVSAPMWPGPAP